VLAITPAWAAAEAPSRASLGNSSSISMSWFSTSMGPGGWGWSERGALCGPAPSDPSAGVDLFVILLCAMRRRRTETVPLAPDRDHEPKQLSRLYSNVIRVILQVLFLPMEKPATSDMLQLPTKALHNKSTGLK